MTAEPATARSLLLAAGISPEKIEAHHAAGRVRLNAEHVEDLDAPAPEGAIAGLWAT